MPRKLQSTGVYRSFSQSLARLETWSKNPWRRYSLFLICLFLGVFLGSSIGMINGALALMDPVGAFLTVVLLEIMIRFRKDLNSARESSFLLGVIDLTRIGISYGLLAEGFKLL